MGCLLEISVLIASTGIVPAPPLFGGAIESHAYVLANAIAEKGATVHFVSDTTPKARFHPRIQIHKLHTPVRRFPAPFPAWILTHSIGGSLSAKVSYQVTLTQKVDVAHFHEETSALLYLALRPKVPVVFTLHNPPSWASKVPSPTEGFVRRTISVLTSQHIIKKVDRFIALSSSIATQFSEQLGLEKNRVKVVPHPIDTDFFRPDDEREREAREKFRLSGPYILFVGRLDPRKGVGTLLRAMAKSRPQVTLVIVGDGVERESLAKLTKSLGLESSTRFLGSVPLQILPGLYSGADCLVLPSLSEMSPLTVIESLSSGSPVVASDLAVLRDIIRNGENGFLVAPTADSLAKAISAVVSDSSLRMKLKRNARQGALLTNSKEVVAEGLLNIYNELV